MNYPTHIVAVSGLIKNNDGKVLLEKSPDRGWEIPGGQVEIGESLIDALKREVKEETGIDIEVDELITVTSNISKRVQLDGVTPIGSIVNFGFTGRYISGELTTSEESLEVDWFDRDKVLNMIGQEFNKDRVKDMISDNLGVVYKAFTREPYVIHEQKFI